MWYRRAAEKGHYFASYDLGNAYLYGEGRDVPQNDVQAYAWFNIAAAQGLRTKGVRDDLPIG